MPVSKEFIASQARNEKGYIAPIKTTSDAGKDIQAQTKNFVQTAKTLGGELNKAFYDELTATANFYIAGADSGEIADAQFEFEQELDNLEKRIQRGEFARKATNYQNKPKAQTSTYQQNNDKQNDKQKEGKYTPILNEQGFVVAHKPKNEFQEAISDDFSAFFEEHIKGKGFSKEAINQFTNSRNFYMNAEKTPEEIDKYLDGILARIQKGTFGVKTDELGKLQERIEKLEKEVSVLKRANKKTTSPTNHDQYLGDNSLSYQVVKERIAQEKEARKNKGYPKEYFTQLYALNKDGARYENQEALEKAIAELNERIKPNPKQNIEAKSETSVATKQAQYNGDDSTDLNTLKEEAKNFQKPNVGNAQRASYRQRQTQIM